MIPGPGWVIAEANEGGSVDSTTVLGLFFRMGTACGATVSPTATGYAITWQDTEGDWLAECDPQTSPQPSFAVVSVCLCGWFRRVESATAHRGAGALRNRLRRAAGAAARRRALADRRTTGNRRAGALIFPSINGNFGTVSALARRRSWLGPLGRDLRRLHSPVVPPRPWAAGCSLTRYVTRVE